MSGHAADAETVISLEHRRIAATIAGDVDTLDMLLHDEMVFGHTNGHADDKRAYLAKFEARSVRYFDADYVVEDVKALGATAFAKIHLKMQAELPTGIRQLNVVALTVWTLDAERWQMVAHHPTVVDF